MNSIRIGVVLLAVTCGAAHAQTKIRVTPEPSLSIGLMDGPEGYLFQFVAAGAFLGSDRIVVGDRGTHTIRIFDARGRLLAESGGEGGGPAEFRYIDSIWVHGDTVLVHDPVARKTVRFNADGAFLSSEPSRDGMTRLPGRGVGDDVWGTRLTGSVPSATRGLTRDAHLVQLHRRGEAVATIERLTGLWRVAGSPYPFSPSFQAVVVRDSLVVLDPTAARLRLFGRNGVSARAVTVPADAVPYREAKLALEHALETRDIRNAPPDLLQRLRNLPEVSELPRLSHMLVDDRDRIWVKQYDPAEDAHWLGGWAGPEGGDWWVVNLATSRSLRVRMPDGVFPLAIEHDRLLGRHRDEYGVQRVVVYRLGVTP
ncbi:hypothetical protein BH23GEM10_BH23GEM10_16870 [soil metagenome]